MTATMLNMELVFADTLTPDQLMLEDLIKFGDSIVEVLGIESDPTGDVYYVGYQDEYGDKDVAEFFHTDLVELYVFVEDE
jgi:predicted secreted protein